MATLSKAEELPELEERYRCIFFNFNLNITYFSTIDQAVVAAAVAVVVDLEEDVVVIEVDEVVVDLVVDEEVAVVSVIEVDVVVDSVVIEVALKGHSTMAVVLLVIKK